MASSVGNAVLRISFDIFVTPLVPPSPPEAREQFEIGAGRTCFDDRIQFVRLAGVLAFLFREKVYLPSACG
jgi:hypothetical protein